MTRLRSSRMCSMSGIRASVLAILGTPGNPRAGARRAVGIGRRCHDGGGLAGLTGLRLGAAFFACMLAELALQRVDLLLLRRGRGWRGAGAGVATWPATAAGGVTGAACASSSWFRPLVSDLKMRMAWPSDWAAPGSFLAPNSTMKATTRITMCHGANRIHV